MSSIRSRQILPGMRANERCVLRLAWAIRDEHRRLVACTKDLHIDVLQWQPASGFNSIGMLLAHIAIVEAYWILAAPSGHLTDDRSNDVIRSAIGIGLNDDGIPLGEAGHHPPLLSGWKSGDYHLVLRRSLKLVLGVLSEWRERDLDRALVPSRKRETGFWVANHLLEHAAGHRGQIQLLRKMYVRKED
jgi:uncharacterized damage-inducible protein DinB